MEEAPHEEEGGPLPLPQRSKRPGPIGPPAPSTWYGVAASSAPAAASLLRVRGVPMRQRPEGSARFARLERGGDTLAGRVGGEGDGLGGKSRGCTAASAGTSASSVALFSGTVVGLTLRPASASARRALRLLEGRAEAAAYSLCAAGTGPPCVGAVAGGTSAAAGLWVALLHFSGRGALGAAVRGERRVACVLIMK